MLVSETLRFNGSLPCSDFPLALRMSVLEMIVHINDMIFIFPCMQQGSNVWSLISEMEETGKGYLHFYIPI